MPRRHLGAALAEALTLLARETADGGDPGGPAPAGEPRCTAVWSSTAKGTVTCWRAASHNGRDRDEFGSPQHMGDAQDGTRYRWSDHEGTTPHQPPGFIDHRTEVRASITDAFDLPPSILRKDPTS
ncbi:hypothetical protein [Streptomyces sp. ITFR-6]|uniref:hypothetical protein n=1 Tax=Streptomyces sp. ITFR-6 TaxID=3075197 RepID=UPI00288A6200|nr:hypothetical protein [Streptomyces sp. ITFR-6]WNI31478.1 hypothetical protein RLT59_23815 [Streptomyces sp. ITFR-6]